MEYFLNRMAAALALGVALLAAVAGAWQNLPVLSLLLRSLVAAGLVYAFIRLGGGMAGRALLHGLAEHELDKQDKEEEKAAGGDAPESEQRKAA
jgi:hypothetical protein